MFRYLIEIPLPGRLPLIGDAIRVPSYGVMLAVGAFVGVWMGARRAPRTPFRKEEIIDVGVLSILWGVVGARLFYVLENHNYFLTERGFLHIFAIWEGGLVYYGGLLLAILYIVFHFLKNSDSERLVAFWDLASPSAIIGLAFTRIGCFLNGCCYGKPTDLPLGLRFPPGSPIFYDLNDPSTYTHQHYFAKAMETGMLAYPPCSSFPVHPTQLYESAFAFALGLLLYWYWPRRKGNGEIGGWFLIGYCTWRFFIEFLRINPALFSWAPLSLSQWVSLPGFAYGVYLVLGSRGIINPGWKAIHPVAPQAQPLPPSAQ